MIKYKSYENEGVITSDNLLWLSFVRGNFLLINFLLIRVTEGTLMPTIQEI